LEIGKREEIGGKTFFLPRDPKFPQEIKGVKKFPQGIALKFWRVPKFPGEKKPT